MSGIVESGTMEGKIRAFIILTSKSRKVETNKREGDPSWSLTDGTLGRKTTPFEKMTDDLQHSNLFSRFVPSFAPLFSAISSSPSRFSRFTSPRSLPPLSTLALFPQLLGAVILYFSVGVIRRNYRRKR